MKVDFKDRLNEAMQLRGLKQTDLVNLTGLGRSAISQYCSGKYEPKQQGIFLLAKALNVNEAWLMGYDVDIERRPIPTVENIVKLPPKKFPIIGSIPAGTPIVAEDCVDYYISLEDDIDADFCLRVQGDSMKDANINDGDIVFLKSQDYVSDGKIHAVLKEDGDTYDTVATLKRVYQQNGGLMLVPANEEYRPEFWNGDKVRVVGKVVYCLSKVK